MNSIRRFITLAGLGLALLTCLRVEAQLFLRPGVQYLTFTHGEYADKAAVSLEFGTSFGAERRNEVSLELLHSEWEYSKPMGSQSGSGFLGDKADGNLDEALFNYRRYFDTGFAGLRWNLGASLGVAFVDGDLDRTLSGVKLTGSYDKTRLTAGAQGGVSYSFGQGLSVNVFLRYSLISSPNFHAKYLGSGTAGQDVELSAMNMATLGCSVHISF